MPKRYVWVNNKNHAINVSDDTPLLWVLREQLLYTGTKFGCGSGHCGACMVHANGEPLLACVTKIGDISGKKIVTIEGLSDNASHPVQRAWLELNVAQCGYCQSGQIMAAAALLDSNPDPDDAAIDTAMSPVLCRCGTYQRVRDAIHHAAVLMAQQAGESP